MDNFFAYGGWKQRHLIAWHLRDNRKLARKVDSNKYEADFICWEKVDKSLLKENQMTYYVTGTRNLDDKVLYSASLKALDKKKIIQNYNSTYANPLSFEIYFNQLGKLKESESQFLQRTNTGVWILKPALTAQGQGIQIVQDIKKIEKAVREKAAGKYNQQYQAFGHQILQKYIEKPLLLDNKKMDFRMYMAILQADPLIVVVFPSYTKKTLINFELLSEDLRVHLGNGDYQQQGVPNYKEIIRKNHHFDIRLFKEKMMDMFPGLSEKQFYIIIEKCKIAITYGVMAAKEHLVKRKGDTQIMGVDFCIDKNYNPWLLEFNTRPYIVASHPILEQILPDFIYDWLDVAIELNKYTKQELLQKSKGNPNFPCQFFRRNKCDILINEAANYTLFDDTDVETLYDQNKDHRFH